MNVAIVITITITLLPLRPPPPPPSVPPAQPHCRFAHPLTDGLNLQILGLIARNTNKNTQARLAQYAAVTWCVLGRSRFTLTRAIVKLYSLVLQGFVDVLLAGPQKPDFPADRTVPIQVSAAPDGLNLRIRDFGGACCRARASMQCFYTRMFLQVRIFIFVRFRAKHNFTCWCGRLHISYQSTGPLSSWKLSCWGGCVS